MSSALSHKGTAQQISSVYRDTLHQLPPSGEDSFSESFVFK
jgi:hypothetical protein